MKKRSLQIILLLSSYVGFTTIALAAPAPETSAAVSEASNLADRYKNPALQAAGEGMRRAQSELAKSVAAADAKLAAAADAFRADPSPAQDANLTKVCGDALKLHTDALLNAHAAATAYAKVVAPALQQAAAGRKTLQTEIGKLRDSVTYLENHEKSDRETLAALFAEAKKLKAAGIPLPPETASEISRRTRTLSSMGLDHARKDVHARRFGAVIERLESYEQKLRDSIPAIDELTQTLADSVARNRDEAALFQIHLQVAETLKQLTVPDAAVFADDWELDPIAVPLPGDVPDSGSLPTGRQTDDEILERAAKILAPPAETPAPLAGPTPTTSPVRAGTSN